MTESARVSGLQGLDGARYSEEAPLLPQMRGGYNVELIDGEWWSRSGLRANDQPVDANVEGCADVPFWWAISTNTDQDFILANPWWAVRYHTELRSYAPGYETRDGVVLVANLTGSNVSYAGASTPEVGDMLFLDPTSDRSQEMRIVIQVTGSTGAWTLTLHKVPLPGAVNGMLMESIAPYRTVANGGGFVGTEAFGASLKEDGPIAIDTGGICIFEQLVTYEANTNNTGGDSGGTASFVNPKIWAGRPYIIITSKFAEPVAFAVTDSSDPTLILPSEIMRGWFRNTSEDPAIPIVGPTYEPPGDGDQVGRGEYCGVVGNRLFIGKAWDDQKRWPETTFWTSRYGDFTRWHVGRKGGNGKGSFFTLDDFSNPIMGMAPMSNAMIVHRSYSQDTATLSGSASTPVNVVKGLKGYGLVSTRSLVPTNRGQYLWTQNGPAVFDGTQLRQIGQNQKRFLESMGLYGNLARELDNADADTNIFDIEGKGVLFGFEDLKRQRIVWVSKNGIRHPKVSTPEPEPHEYTLFGRIYNYARTAVVYDYSNNQWFNYDVPTLTGAGTRYNPTSGFETVALTCDGYVYEWSPNNRAFDEPLSGHVDLSRPREVVDGYVESGWMNFGTETRKMLNKLTVELRSFQRNNQGPGGNYEFADGVLYEIREDWLSSPETVLHFCTVEIYADSNDETEAFQEIECTMEVQKMWAYETEENRQSTRMLFELTPRATANQFKFGFRNAYQADVPIAGVERAPFRIAAFEPGWDETGSDRLRYPANKR